MWTWWCLVALIFGVAGSLVFAGLMLALDWYCHRHHPPAHARSPDEGVDVLSQDEGLVSGTDDTRVYPDGELVPPVT